MLKLRTRNGTSNTSIRVVQLSTLERARRTRPTYRYVPQSTSIASTITRMQLAASRGFAGLMIITLTLFYPAGAFANETTPTETTTAPTTTETQPATTETQPTTTSSTPAPEPQPAPSTTTTQTAPTTTSTTSQPAATSKTTDSKPKYTWNEALQCWENGTYCWDPNTGQTRPLNSPDISYNPETEAWDTKDWRYDPASGEYVPNTPQLAPTNGEGISLGGGNSQFFDLYYNANISNNVYSYAQTGDALVYGNTLGGNAVSGNALTIANIFNMLNSSIGLTGGSQIATFSSDIYGDVFGDLYIDPSALAATQPAIGINGDNADVELNVAVDNKIENNIILDAQSGDATVGHNTQAGSATSGSANAVANIINFLNTAISTGSSFIGLLNIYGSLNGDILFPDGLLNYLLAANGAGGGSGNSSTDVTLNDSQTITNNVNANAESGTATVAHNTSAGTATTGDSQTNVTILNLTGRQVVAANSLLVFVNVLGTWVGVIMDAPAGSTSAVLGSGVTENSCSVCSGDVEVNADTNQEITNNINVNASSGDANVTDNTQAGNATTGDATASVNLANLTSSSFNLSDWFGVLFINVFGTWNGSFGVDTAAGEHPASPVSSNHGSKPKVFRFVPNGQGGTTLASADEVNDAAYAAAVQKATKAAQEKLAKTSSASTQRDDYEQEQEPYMSTEEPKGADLFLPVVGFAIGGSLLGGERLVSRRQRRRTAA